MALRQHPTMGRWEPVLSDSHHARASDVLTAITEALSLEECSPSRLGPGLAGGNAGLALLYDQLCRCRGAEFESRRDARWSAAIDQVAGASQSHPNLYGGYCGLGWATALMDSSDPSRDRDAEDRDGTHEELEEALLEDLESLPDPAIYDLVGGPVGWGVYSLQRWPHPRANRALERIVDFLERAAAPADPGLRWWTPPELMPEWQRERSPRGYYNLGVAHGVPGICAFLGQVLERGIRVDTTRRLLEGAVDWVLSQRIESVEGLRFPATVSDGESARPSRLAWCYGDLGLAAALLVAAECAGEERWRAESLAIARNAARVPFESSGARDAGLCHGAAGIAHVFNRMAQSTGDEELRLAAHTWLARTLEMRVPGQGLAGYAAWRSDGDRPTGSWRWDPLPGVLEGAAGVALALLAGSTSIEPAWDRFLLISRVPLPTA